MSHNWGLWHIVSSPRRLIYSYLTGATTPTLHILPLAGKGYQLFDGAGFSPFVIAPSVHFNRLPGGDMVDVGPQTTGWWWEGIKTSGGIVLLINCGEVEGVCGWEQ